MGGRVPTLLNWGSGHSPEVTAAWARSTGLTMACPHTLLIITRQPQRAGFFPLLFLMVPTVSLLPIALLPTESLLPPDLLGGADFSRAQVESWQISGTSLPVFPTCILSSCGHAPTLYQFGKTGKVFTICFPGLTPGKCAWDEL